MGPAEVEKHYIMKILQVHSFFHPHVGGSETYVLELSKRLIRRGHQVVVVTSKLPGTLERECIEGIEVIRVAGYYFPKVPYFLFSPQLFSVLMRFAPQFDLIHSHVRFFFSTNCVAFLRKIRKNGCFVLTLHATQPKTQIAILQRLENLYEHTLGRFTVGAADAVIALDENMRDHVMHYGRYKKKISLIPNGVDIERFEPRPNNSSFLFQIGYIGNLVYRKGVHDLIQAVSELPKNLSFQLNIVGDGPEYHHLQLLCHQLRVEQSISFLGVLDKDAIPNFLHELDVLVLPSLSEGMPTVVLEAMASGVPVIATDVGATKTLIDSEDVGLLIPPQAPQAISQALSCLYSEKETRQKMTENARKRVEQFYSWDAIADQVEAVYKEVLDG